MKTTMTLFIACGFAASVLASGCARTTVHRANGDTVRGKLVHTTPDTVVLETRIKDKLPVERADGSVAWRDSVQIAWVEIHRDDIALVKRQDKVALAFAISGTVLAGVGLIALGPAVSVAENCRDPKFLGCLTEAIAPFAVGSMAVTGALVAVPSWIAWGATRKNVRGPRFRPGLTGFSGTF